MLLDHGVLPDQIARDRFWEGEESDAIRSDIRWLLEMQRRTPAHKQVGDLRIPVRLYSVRRSATISRSSADGGQQ